MKIIISLALLLFMTMAYGQDNNEEKAKFYYITNDNDTVYCGIMINESIVLGRVNFVVKAFMNDTKTRIDINSIKKIHTYRFIKEEKTYPSSSTLNSLEYNTQLSKLYRNIQENRKSEKVGETSGIYDLDVIKYDKLNKKNRVVLLILAENSNSKIYFRYTEHSLPDTYDKKVKYHFYINENGSITELKKKHHKEKLLEFFSDCQMVVKEFSEDKKSYEHIVYYTEMYNACKEQ
tara:strand:- start:966 stop:1667 length:702 start_codon:yes stop_codon:yes gene_type:complete